MGKRYYDYNRNYFEEINTSSKAYFFGFIMGDGTIQKPETTSRSLRIGIQERDIEVLEQFIEEIGGDLQQIKLRKKNPPRQNIVDLMISSNKIVNDLQKNGLSIIDKTNVQEWPNISKKYISDFIRGLIDSDGSIYIRKDLKTSSIVFWISFNGTLKMCKGFKKNFEKYILDFETKQMVRQGNGAVYEWRYGTTKVEIVKKILKNLYPNIDNLCCLRRKKEKFNEFFEKVRQNAPYQISLADYPKHIAFLQTIPGCSKKCNFCFNSSLISTSQFDKEYVLKNIFFYLNDIEAILFGGGEPLGFGYSSMLFIAKEIRKKDDKIKIGIQTSSYHPDARSKIKELSPDFVSFTVNSGRKKDITTFNNQKEKEWESKLIYIPGKIENYSKYEIDVVQQFQPGECLDPSYNDIPQPSRDEVMEFAKSIGAKEIITKSNGRELVC